MRRSQESADLVALRHALRDAADPTRVPALQRYFKTGVGEYGEGDRFLGLRVPQVRTLARRFRALDPASTHRLLLSPWHEERQVALFIMVEQYQRGSTAERFALFREYLENTSFINNWDLIDASAPRIVGAHLFPDGLSTLEQLASSSSVWERRIAIIATSYWIQHGDYRPTMRLAVRLLRDEHDLIQKAVGWMLREVGKRDRAAEEAFLGVHAARMPRTMLRYAIEHLPERRRRHHLGAVRR